MPWTYRVMFVLLLATVLWGAVVHFRAPEAVSPPIVAVHGFQAPHPDFSVPAAAWPRREYHPTDEISAPREPSIAELLALARTDPAAAAARALQITDPTAREEAAVKIALLWGKTDLTAAFAWAQGLTNGIPLKQNLLCSLCEQEADTDPVGALNSAMALDVGDQKNSLVENLAMHWAAQDAGAALDWALQTPDEVERDRLVGRVTASLAEQSPAAAAEVVATKMAAGEAQDQAALAVIYKWTRSDPVAAANWVGNFPEGSQQTEAVQNLIGVWAMTDEAAAARWVAALPAGAAQSAGTVALEQARQRLLATDAHR